MIRIMLSRSRVYTNKRGFNLIEVAIVLGIIGLVVGGIWVVAAKLRDDRRTEETYSGMVQGLQRIKQEISPTVIRALIAAHGGTGAMDQINSWMFRTDVFPSNWRDTNCQMIRVPFPVSGCSSWAGLRLNSFVGGTGGGLFGMEIPNLPISACVKLLVRFSQQMPDPIWAMSVNGGTEVTGPISPATASNLCFTAPTTKFPVLEPDHRYRINVTMTLGTCRRLVSPPGATECDP
jgi:prepilin-type N-terminal cleavage/methylation domain-containing protein